MRNGLTLIIMLFILNSCVWDAVDAVIEIVDPPEEMETSDPPPYSPGMDDAEIFDAVDFPDEEAEFNGGTAEMMKWIQSNVEYPPMAIANDEQGKVYVSFVVKSDGSIRNVAIERGASPSLDREAKRVIKRMPKWSPGKVDGKKVTTRCRLPIVFTLE